MLFLAFEYGCSVTRQVLDAVNGEITRVSGAGNREMVGDGLWRVQRHGGGRKYEMVVVRSQVKNGRRVLVLL